MRTPDMTRAYAVADIMAERAIQDVKWGQQNHPDGTGEPESAMWRDSQRAETDRRAREGELTWADILAEEYAEALAETDPAKLREELVQVAAVSLAWIEAIDRRAA